MSVRPAGLAAILAAVIVAAAAVVVLRWGARPPTPVQGPPAAGLARATFAGGCFWCMEPPFERLPGVKEVVSGYTGGYKPNPTYSEVSSGGTGHRESVQVVYDPAQVSYEALLDVFWHNVDPTIRDRQFCDVGEQYGTAVFYEGEEQKRLAEASLRALQKSKPFAPPIVTPLLPAGPFYRAEEYHQDYSRKNPVRYRFYRWNCGRDARLRELWGAAAPH